LAISYQLIGMRLKNKTVIITGASSGIGKAMAYAFAKEGANLVLAARQYVKMCEIAQDIEATFKVKAIAVAADISKEEYCKQLIGEAVKAFGGIDVLVNNAGISMRALLEDLDLKVIKDVMDINFWGTVYCTKYALPEIIKSKGTIVGISSIAGHKGLPGRTGYSASKFAVQGFLESVRVENLKKGVNVLVACPGFTASNIRNVALSKDGTAQGESPLDEKNITQPEEVANRIVNGVIHRKRELIMTVQGKFVVWLNKFFPAILDKMVYNHFAKEPDSPLK
jgi:short-subunit dehydrogenase